MHKKREVIKIRYRKSDGTLTRPYKVQKIIYDDNSIEYHNMNMSTRKKQNSYSLEHITTNSKGKEKIHYSINPESFVTTWDQPIQVKTRAKTILHKFKHEELRVKFINKKDSTIKHSRPTTIYKVTEIINYSVKENGIHVAKQKDGLTIYLSSIKRLTSDKEIAIRKIDQNTFITEWEKGPTPHPSRKIHIKHNPDAFPYGDKDIKLCNKLLKREGKLQEIIDTALTKKVSTRLYIKMLIEEGKINVEECKERFHTSNLEKKKQRQAQHQKRMQRKLIAYNGKEHTTATVFVQSEIADPNDNTKVTYKTVSKSFNSKGLFKNQDYKHFVKQNGSLVDIQWKTKRDSKENNRRKMIALQQDPKHKEKIAFSRKKRKKNICVKGLKERWIKRQAFLNTKAQKKANSK